MTMNLTKPLKNFSKFKQWMNFNRQGAWGLTLGLMLSVTLFPIAATKADASLSLLNFLISNETIAMSQVALPKEIEAEIRQNLARRTKLKANQFEIKQATPQTWADGCLGLGTANELCTQALVSGWRVVMGYQQQTWTYRTDDTGRSLRLE